MNEHRHEGHECHGENVHHVHIYIHGLELLGNKLDQLLVMAHGSKEREERFLLQIAEVLNQIDALSNDMATVQETLQNGLQAEAQSIHEVSDAVAALRGGLAGTLTSEQEAAFNAITSKLGTTKTNITNAAATVGSNATVLHALASDQVQPITPAMKSAVKALSKK